MRRTRPPSIRGKMSAISVGPAILMGLTALLTVYVSLAAVGRVNALFDESLFLRQLGEDLGSARLQLEAYIATKNTDNLRSYSSASRKLAKASAVLDVPISGRDDRLVERNVSVLLKRYIIEADKAVDAKRGRNVTEYTNRFRRSEAIASYVVERVNTLSLIGLGSSVGVFKSFSRNLSRALWLSVCMIGSALVFGIFLVAYSSYRLTDPIVRLSAEAAKISSGTLDATELEVESHDEIGAMTKAFNLMKLSLAQYIGEMRNKAEIEGRLMEERVKNLEMAGALRNAEIRTLQARINPHFLFNTLNAGIQLSVVEGAERTRVFLENLSSLMRYSFRNLDAPVVLGDELDCLDSYMHVMAIRFPDMFSFMCSVGEDERRLVVPKMIIQPLVENSFMHGFKDVARGAILSVRARREGGDVVIEVEDNGHGMTRERADAAIAAASRTEGPGALSDPPDAAGSSQAGGSDGSGLGLSNVIRRLRLFSGREDVLSIERGPMGGTLVSMRLPFRTEY